MTRRWRVLAVGLLALLAILVSCLAVLAQEPGPLYVSPCEDDACGAHIGTLEIIDCTNNSASCAPPKPDLVPYWYCQKYSCKTWYGATYEAYVLSSYTRNCAEYC